MKSDQALVLLTGENPVHEDGLPGPESADALALKGRILRSNRAPARSSRRIAFRLAAVGLAAAAVAFSALSVLPGDGPSAVERATAALETPDDTILHTVVVSTRRDPDGTISTERDETWQRNSFPYDHRQVMTSRGHRREIGSTEGRPLSYDALTNTVYTVVPGTKLPSPTPPRNEAGVGVDRLRMFLKSGDARVAGRLTVGGREAIRIVFSSTMLIVDAQTYRPLRWTSVSDEGIRVTSRFDTYELLPANQANLPLVDIARQHPGASVKPGITVTGFDEPKGK